MLLIDDLLFWLPAKGLVSVLKKIEEKAVAEHKNLLTRELLAAEEDLAAGRISGREYAKIEKAVIKQLKTYVKRK